MRRTGDAVPAPLRFRHSGLTDEKTADIKSTVQRISRSKRKVAPQRCLDYATI